MERTQDNMMYSAGFADSGFGRARTVPLGGARRSGAWSSPDGSQLHRRPSAADDGHAHRRAEGRQRMSNRQESSRTSQRRQAKAQAPKREPRQTASSRLQNSNFMRYANDNSVIKALYDFTHGTTRPLFIALILIAVGVGLYFPVRDLYVAKRSGEILAQQVKIREEYNESLQKDVDKLLSEDGIKDVATEKLGLVMPGEKKINIEGLDDDTSAKKDSSQAKAASKVEAAEQKVAQDAPWYIKMLDTVFMFNGVEGQEVASSGNN